MFLNKSAGLEIALSDTGREQASIFCDYETKPNYFPHLPKKNSNLWARGVLKNSFPSPPLPLDQPAFITFSGYKVLSEPRVLFAYFVTTQSVC